MQAPTKNELPPEPIERFSFVGAKDESRYAESTTGLQVMVQRVGLHDFNIGVTDPASNGNAASTVRLLQGGYDTTTHTHLNKDAVVMVAAQLQRYSDRVLISMECAAGGVFFVFFRDPKNIAALDMLTFKYGADSADLSSFDFFEQGTA